MITIEYIQRLRNKAKVHDMCSGAGCPFDESVLCVCADSKDQIMLPDIELLQASHVCQHSLNELIQGYDDLAVQERL